MTTTTTTTSATNYWTATAVAATVLTRSAEDTAWLEAVRKGREEIAKKTLRARKAIGVRKNEANPGSICQRISQWELEMNVALYKEFHCKSD